MVTNPDEGPDSVKVIRDGILIKKSLEGSGKTPVPRVRFDLVSKREDVVRVRFVDPLPETLSSEQVVFDPDDETDYAVGGPHSVTFEARLQPGREYVTHYTVHEPPNGLEGLLQAPRLESIEVVDTEEKPVDPTSADREETADTVDSSAKTGGLASLKGLLSPSASRESVSLGTDESTALDVGAQTEIVPAEEPDGIPTIRTSTAGITLERALSLEDGALLTTIDVSLIDRDAAVSVVVTDRVPGTVALREVEFNPSQAPDTGRITDDDVTFRLDLSPEENRVVTYGAIPWVPLDAGDLRQLQSRVPPQFEIVAGGAGNQTPVGAPDVTLSELFDEELETVSVPDGADLAERVVHAIVSDEVDETIIDSLRERLGVGELPGSHDARLRHLETRTAEFSAYAETIETFLDQHGPAAEAFGSLEDEITELRSALEGLEENRTAVRHRLDRLATDLEQVDEASATRVRRLRDQLDSLESVHNQDISQLEGSLKSIQDDLQALHGEVEAEQERWSTLSEAFD